MQLKNVMKSLPHEDLVKIIEQFKENNLNYIWKPFNSWKHEEDTILGICKIIDIIYTHLSQSNAALMSYNIKKQLWALFYKVFRIHFELPSACKENFAI